MAAYTVREECGERTGEYRENEAGEDRDPLHLLVLWLLGMLTSYTFYGFIHILLVIALVILVIRLVQGRRAL